MLKLNLLESMLYGYKILFEANFSDDELFSGEYVSNYVKEITPDKDDIPFFFINKYIRPNDGWKLVDIELSSLLSDPSFSEYIESEYQRYDENESDYNDLYQPLVVYKGELLDGFNRASTLMRNGEISTQAFVLT